MKTLIIFILMLGFVSTPNKGDTDTFDYETMQEEVKQKEVPQKARSSDLIKAIIEVESSGSDKAFNKSENAVGCLQIRPIMVREVNRLLKRARELPKYTLKDRWDREKSIEIFKIFNKGIKSLEEKARRWNGGPKGMVKSSTIKYWKKVKSRIK
jgi:hypothetical protein